MFKPIKILDENDPIVREKNIDVTFPLSKEDKKMIQHMIDHLTNSQIEELSIKYDLRPGMGLAAPQVGINKNYFVVVHEVDEQVFDNYVLINPKIVSHSEELIYASTGEGCLSVNREVEGIVPRFARVTIEAYDEDGNKIRVRAREELAIAFQHEFDHLNGILFTDRIDKDNPFKDKDKMRMI
ncbi:MAG: peptide deformylase [Bacilli bacterium]|nr:peptide deformylase [Bacilli bacterium]